MNVNNLIWKFQLLFIYLDIQLKTKKMTPEINKQISNLVTEAYSANLKAASNKSWDKGAYGSILSQLKRSNSTKYLQNLQSRALRGAYALNVYLLDYYNRHQEIPQVNIKVKGHKCDIDVLDKEYGPVEIKFGANEFTTENKKAGYVKEITGATHYYLVLAEKNNVPGHERKQYTRKGKKYSLWFLTDMSKIELSRCFHIQHSGYVKY